MAPGKPVVQATPRSQQENCTMPSFRPVNAVWYDGLPRWPAHMLKAKRLQLKNASPLQEMQSVFQVQMTSTHFTTSEI